VVCEVKGKNWRKSGDGKPKTAISGAIRMGKKFLKKSKILLARFHRLR
jgi:hypothetical protein